jgi:hypothetical protein
MIDKTPLETCALEAALIHLVEVAVEIGIGKPLAEYSRAEALTVAEAVVSGYQDYLLEHSRHKEGEDYMTLDFNHRPTLSEKINGLIDAALQEKDFQQPQRDYLGASRLGVSCSRALQYEYLKEPRDQPFTGKLLRVFELGHVLEGMAIKWLEGAGFEIAACQPDGGQFGFSTAGGRIKGHVDGIIYNAPAEIGMGFPALWECKSMNAKSWKQTVDKGVRVAKPIYAVQVALYQAYMEATVPGISTNPALFTSVNKDTSEIYHELVAFDAALAQEASDRGVNILRATVAGETLPRISLDPDFFECRFCDWKDKCWTEEPGKETL